MGLDARIIVQLMSPISDDALIDASYRLSEALGEAGNFWVSSDEELARSKIRRALNRWMPGDKDSDYELYGVEAKPGETWLWISQFGRYYGPGYERGPLWTYIAIAEWLEQEFTGCRVFYGSDTGEPLTLFNHGERRRLIGHWAKFGSRPYYGEGRSRIWPTNPNPLRPTCPLCQHPATQNGSGATFASWQCDGCHRQWVWTGSDVKAFPPAKDFDAFNAAKEMRDKGHVN